MKQTHIIFLGIVSILLLPNPVNAQTQTQLIPPDITNPTKTNIDLYITDILAIDEKMQTYEIDGYLSAEWHDPRQSFNPQEFGYDWKIYRGEMINSILEKELWWPDLYLLNSKGKRETTASMLFINPNGTIYYEERFRATIKQAFQLENFPFDTHNLNLTISSYSYTDYEVEFDTQNEATNFEWMTNEWKVTNTGKLTYESISGYPTVTYALGIKRLPGFYFSKYILPLALIVTISSIVFWIGPDNMNIADRIEIIITSLLTVVAFDFVSSENLPKLSYLTTLDLILILSYIVLTLTMAETLIQYMYQQRQKKEISARLDRISRFLIPIAYYASIITIFLINNNPI